MRRNRIAFSAGVALVIGAISATAAQQSNDQLKQSPDTGVEAPAATQVPQTVLGTRNIDSVLVVRRAGGARQAILNESFDDALVAVRNADGTFSYTCLHGLPAATAHLAHATSNPAPQPVSQAPVLEEK